MQRLAPQKTIACVTGATGLVGRRIVELLLSRDFCARVLSRQGFFDDVRAKCYQGDVTDPKSLVEFVDGAQLLFHCAAEVNDEAKMWEVNVRGTENVFNVARRGNVKYFCHLSSAGVVGATSRKVVDEEDECNPQNLYEQSKLAAERIVAAGIADCRIVVLRPTNIVDETRLGALSVFAESGFFRRMKLFVKGGEGAHIVHAQDVADAALYFIAEMKPGVQCYFVSYDHDNRNTFAGIGACLQNISRGKTIDGVKPYIHMPLGVPHLLRTLARGPGNRGDVRYSSAKLLSTGFEFRLGFEAALRRILVAL